MNLGNIIPQLSYTAAAAIFANQALWGNDVRGREWVEKQKQMQDYQMVHSQQVGNNGLFQDLKDILSKQITMIEPSPAEKKLKELEAQGKPF